MSGSCFQPFSTRSFLTMKICRCCKQVTSQSSFFLVSWPEQIYHLSPKCPFQAQCSFWGCFHTFPDLGCGYKTGCYMPVFYLPILYMEIKIPPPLSIPLDILACTARLFIISFLWTKITDSSLPWLEAQRQDACSRFPSPGLYFCRHYIAVVKLFLLISTAEICLGHCNSLLCLQKSDNVSIWLTYYAALFTSRL